MEDGGCNFLSERKRVINENLTMPGRREVPNDKKGANNSNLKWCSYCSYLYVLNLMI
jgi:hypothetical protein